MMNSLKKVKTNPAKEEILPKCSDLTISQYIREISHYPVLSATEELALAKLAHNGDEEAKKKLIQSNLRLVVSIAKKSVYSANLPLVDLIQEGNLGLLIALEKFNYKLGYKFSTYAAWWVKQSMFKAISEQSYCMKIPVYIQETLSKFSKVKQELEQSANTTVKNEDVAKKMNIEPDKIDLFLSAYSKSISIDSEYTLSNGGEVSFANILVDEKANVLDAIEEKALKDDLNFVISQLKKREQDVIRLRFGLNNLQKKTLEDIGRLYGVTKECIRQTEQRALNKIRNLAAAKLLVCYI